MSLNILSPFIWVENSRVDIEPHRVLGASHNDQGQDLNPFYALIFFKNPKKIKA